MDYSRHIPRWYHQAPFHLAPHGLLSCEKEQISCQSAVIFTSETQSFGGPVYAQKISLLAASARVKHLERGQTTCFTSKSQLRNPETIAHRPTPTVIRINSKIRRFGAHERVRQRVLNMEFSFPLLANMSDNQACAL